MNKPLLSIKKYFRKHSKYVPVVFFICGFIFDTLTLGRIDRLYDLSILSLHMVSLTVMLYLYNLADDGKWVDTFIEPYEKYLPLAIQFYFGALSSAYVIYFSRSVSLSKTISFFVILVTLLIANEFLKQRISNKYLQFSVYFFINFTFFSFIIPVFVKEVNPEIFILSGIVSLVITLIVIIGIYKVSPTTRVEIHLGKMLGIIATLYILINTFYYLRLIPPVPLALDEGIVAHSVVKDENNNYNVIYETDDWWVFWRDHRPNYVYKPGDNVFIFTSIFAPTDIKKTIIHRWNWYDKKAEEWITVDEISYTITGGRDAGYRGYSYKGNVKQGQWEVEVVTEEGLILGVIDFELIVNNTQKPKRLVEQVF